MELLILLAITLVVTSLAALFCWIRAKRKKKRVSDINSKFINTDDGELTYIGDEAFKGTITYGVRIFGADSGPSVVEKFTVEKFEN